MMWSKIVEFTLLNGKNRDTAISTELVTRYGAQRNFTDTMQIPNLR